MSQLGVYFYVREAAPEVDGDQRRIVGISETIAGNKFMAVEFAVHPFESLIDYRALCLSVLRKLLETTLKDWASVLKSTSDRSEQFDFHPTVPPLDLCLLTEVAP